MKICRECNVEKPLSEFYVHAKMNDGHLNKCKHCVKARISRYVKANPDKKKQWSKNYANSEAGLKRAKAYLLTEKGKAVSKNRAKNYRKNHPIRDRATYLANYEIKCGRLIRPEVCSCCNAECKPHAHHENYTKPLDVTWLCEPCHKEWHRQNKPIYE